MNIATHKAIDKELCGRPLEVTEGYSRIELTTVDRMAVDDKGLVHGGFVFGLADYAAMLAVNHPNVVLAGAEVKFTKPVRAGETLIAEATVDRVENTKHIVTVSVKRDDSEVFNGRFSCFVLEAHVLDGT
ncbi:MAG: PaaI family thioesterase [Thermodesulfobacteriota bacterium]|nr:PaaI family thioesterase [Thermodesulfobacteriota bacterium]